MQTTARGKETLGKQNCQTDIWQITHMCCALQASWPELIATPRGTEKASVGSVAVEHTATVSVRVELCREVTGTSRNPHELLSVNIHCLGHWALPAHTKGKANSTVLDGNHCTQHSLLLPGVAAQLLVHRTWRLWQNDFPELVSCDGAGTICALGQSHKDLKAGQLCWASSATAIRPPRHPPPAFFLKLWEKAELVISGTSWGDNHLARITALYAAGLWNSLLARETEVRLRGSCVAVLLWPAFLLGPPGLHHSKLVRHWDIWIKL